MNSGRKIKTLLLASALALASVVGASGCPDSGQAAEDFSLKTVGGGQPVTLSKLKGKPTLVVFWATWCPPCRREIPDLKAMYVKYGTRLNMLAVAVNYRQTERDVAAFAATNGLQYTLLWDADNKAADHYCVSGIPTVVLVDPEGIIRYKANGISSELEGLLDSFTAKKT